MRQQSQALGELMRLPAGIRDRALREHGAAAFYDRYRPLLPRREPGRAAVGEMPFVGRRALGVP